MKSKCNNLRSKYTTSDLGQIQEAIICMSGKSFDDKNVKTS